MEPLAAVSNRAVFGKPMGMSITTFVYRNVAINDDAMSQPRGWASAYRQGRREKCSDNAGVLPEMVGLVRAG